MFDNSFTSRSLVHKCISLSDEGGILGVDRGASVLRLAMALYLLQRDVQILTEIEALSALHASDYWCSTSLVRRAQLLLTTNLRVTHSGLTLASAHLHLLMVLAFARLRMVVSLVPARRAHGALTLLRHDHVALALHLLYGLVLMHKASVLTRLQLG